MDQKTGDERLRSDTTATTSEVKTETPACRNDPSRVPPHPQKHEEPHWKEVVYEGETDSLTAEARRRRLEEEYGFDD